MGEEARRLETHNGADRVRQLSEAYRQPLTAYFLRRVRTREEAEDLTQEAFLRLVRRMDAEPVDNPEAFLFRIAVNLLRDRARRDGVAAKYVIVGDGEPIGLEEISPERVLQGRQSLQTVTRILAELDVRSRDAFILHRLEGLKYAEIAALYGVSVSSVEKYIIKALAHLAKRLGQV